MQMAKLQRLFYRAVLFFGVLLASGCAGLKEYTLPATQETSYDFSSYTVNPPGQDHWRFYYKDPKFQSVSFINSQDYSVLTFWVMPYFENQSTENTSKGIVEYFQNKLLKEYRLSPDLRLKEEDIKHSQETISGKTYEVLALNYIYEKEPYDLKIFYYVDQDNQLLFDTSYLINQKKIKEDLQPQFLEEMKQTMSQIKAKKVDPKDVILLRVYYSYADFIDSTKDKYLMEKQGEIKEKFQTALHEIEDWVRLKTPNDKALNLWGNLTTYNNKFEEYGEGFDAAKAENYFRQAILASSYNVEAHMNLAKLLKHTKKIDEAVKEYQAALVIS